MPQHDSEPPARRLADFVLIDKDLFKIPPAEIRDAKVLMTVVGGKVVYEVK